MYETMPDSENVVLTRKQKNVKKFMFLLKLTVTIVALWLVLSQLDTERFVSYVKDAHVGYLIAALLMLNVGQIISAYRLRYYFSVHKVAMPAKVAIALYYIGLFFNHFLPGGVGGDGYKVWYAKKHYDLVYKNGVRLVVSARLNGLYALCLITAVLIPFSQEMRDVIPFFPMLFSGLLVLGVAGYSATALWLLKEAFSTQYRALCYSLVVQLINMFTVVCILQAINVDVMILNYLIIFMIACVVSILPISLGGVGLRELTFLMSAELVGLDVEVGVAIAFLYFIINALASLLGIVFFYQHKSNQEKTR